MADDYVCFDAISSDDIDFVPYYHFCALYLDSCDVVGPIMGIDKSSNSNESHWYIYGFVTQVRRYCEPTQKLPYVGTKIVPYLDWIESILQIKEN